MAITGTSIVREVYRLLNRPSQDVIRYQDVLDNTADVIRGLLLDLKMSNRNRDTDVGEWRTPVAISETTDKYTGSATHFLLVSAQWRIKDNDNDIPNTVELCALEQIDENSHLPQDYIAIYKNSTLVRFSQNLETLARREYRLIYEDLSDVDFDELSDSTTNFPDLFSTLVKYKTAYLTINQVDLDTEQWALKRERLLRSIEPMYMEWNEKFDKWRKSRYGNRVTHRKGFRPPTRYRR